MIRIQLWKEREDWEKEDWAISFSTNGKILYNRASNYLQLNLPVRQQVLKTGPWGRESD